ncbi:hypothetical protein TrRE_jg10048 [Triparma retinervis]|uniref:Protein kinase domain-containing protein n=1 Tax=Triparma retinervis TaxID=2557542 RepID=A0A9W6ZJV7_9STRA|nr:hypothetical protein TrRE_jg10048 [Triparma retinervis]
MSEKNLMVKPADSSGGLRSGQYLTTPCEDNYTFGRTLGKGSFATVKIATCKADKSKWAVKIIDKHALNDEDKDALQIECDTMMQVNHNNIVKLKEVYDNKDKFYMILEICAGGELFDRIVEVEHYTENEARFAFSQMTEAVGHCHKVNIVHRDLKPENLLYEGPAPNMTLKLADFGLAQIVTPMKHLHTACGTPGYVAPEILKGKEYGAEVDMWSLGVILYILICGFPPFYEEHTPELFKIIKRGEYDFPEPYWDDVSEEAKDLISKLLIVDPKKRYTAAQVFEHPWMASENQTKEGKPLVHFIGNMKKYNAKRKFKGAIEGVMMANMMKRIMNAGRTLDAERAAAAEDVAGGVVAAEEAAGAGGNATASAGPAAPAASAEPAAATSTAAA